jgi:hypothetical protein
VKHAVHNDILRVLGLTSNPRPRIGARRVLAHEKKVFGVFGGCVFGNGQLEILPLKQVGIAHPLAWVSGPEYLAFTG